MTVDASQDGFGLRFDWGIDGLRALAPAADVVVVVDVLRFTSAVSAAVEIGAIVLPYQWGDEGAAAHAVANDAVLAGRREDGGLSLSPTDMLLAEPGTRVVLPSPNGSTLSFSARDLGARHVLAGAIRNATATARRARELAGREGVVAVIAAGEQWSGSGGRLRPSVEDLLGAGAVLAALDPPAAIGAEGCSPDAAAARAAFVMARPLLRDALRASTSGRELIEHGWSDDVDTAAAHDVTALAAELIGNEFVAR